MNSTQPDPVAGPNPFRDDVFSGDLSASCTLDHLYAGEIGEVERVIEQLKEEFSSSPRAMGQTLLITSPKAGAGKSHLLARLSEGSRGQAHFCEITMEDPSNLSWMHFFWRVLSGLHAQRDSESDGTALTGVICGLFADGTSRLIAEGKVPCESPAVAGKWLDENSRKIFDGASQELPSVRWFKDEFLNLAPRLSEHFAKQLLLDSTDTQAWLCWMFRYAAAGQAGHSFTERRQLQRDLLNEAEFLRTIQDENSAKTALRILGRLVTRERPLVLVLDGLDWFYRDHASGLKLARMVEEIGRLVPHSLCALSVNEDLWKETFVAGLPEAVQDRLTRSSIRLEGVPRADWEKFLTARANFALGSTERAKFVAAEVLASREDAVLPPRALLRQAAKRWTSPTLGSTAPSSASTTRTDSSSASPTSLWVDVMGGLKELISARDQNRSEAGESPSLTPADAAFRRTEPVRPAGYPPLTVGLRSFLARVKSRAESREDYLPSGGAPMDSARARRNSIILHGKSPEEDAFASPETSGDASPQAATRLVELRREFAQAGLVTHLDFPRIERLLEIAGRLFPAIVQDRVAIPGLPQQDALHWRFQQNEVYFGCQPYREEEYWKKLIGCTASMARRKRDQSRGRVKLVVLGHAEDKEVFPAWEVEPYEAPDLQFCDNVLLNSEQLSNLYAVEQLLSEAPTEEALKQLFSQVSGQLDFFWKMVTRSVWTIVSQFAAAK